MALHLSALHALALLQLSLQKLFQNPVITHPHHMHSPLQLCRYEQCLNSLAPHQNLSVRNPLMPLDIENYP